MGGNTGSFLPDWTGRKWTMYVSDKSISLEAFHVEVVPASDLATAKAERDAAWKQRDQAFEAHERFAVRATRAEASLQTAREKLDALVRAVEGVVVRGQLTSDQREVWDTARRKVIGE